MWLIWAGLSQDLWFLIHTFSPFSSDNLKHVHTEVGGGGGEKEREVETRSSEGLVKPGFIADAVLHGCILFVKAGYNEWGKLTLPLYGVYYKISKKHGWGGKLGYFYSLVCCPLQNALELRTWYSS